MTLAPHKILPYLLQHHLVSPEAVLAGEVAIVDASRRNQNVKVINRAGASYLLKQGATLAGVAAVAREAACYVWFAALAPSQTLAPLLPHCYGYDQDLLILSLEPEAEDLQRYHARRLRFSPRIAAAMGAALGQLHRLPRGSGAPVSPAWVLSIHRPQYGFMATISSANLQLTRIVQEFDGLCAHLDDLRQQWQAQAFIHGDLKWDHVILSRSQPSRLKLVDWESAGIGEPCWDIGCILQEYPSLWLNSVPISGKTPLDRFSHLARFPLALTHPAIAAFWGAYCRVMQLEGAAATERLYRSIRYAGARLIQTAYQQMQTAHRLTGNAICLLQMGWNMMADPARAGWQLMGLR